MESTFQKILRWTAIPGILGGLLYLGLAFNRFFPTLDTSIQSMIDMVIGIGLIFSIIFWLTGIYLWQKDEIKITGHIGYVVAMIGFILIGIWLYISDFRDLEKTFSLWNSIAMVLFTWGIMMFGTASINAGRFPHLATVLWIVGLILGNAGLAYKWSGRLYLVAAGMIWCGIYFWIGYKNEKKASVPKTTVTESSQRVVSLDILRGLIMIVMAIDHASMFIRRTHPFEFWNLPVTSYFGDSLVFLTRFVTHFCAPGFFFLMGTGMILFSDSRKKNGWTHGKVMWHLTIRGFLIIILEKILWTPIVYGTMEFTKFGVLYGLGGAMLVCILFLRLNKIVLIGIGLTGILLTQVLPQHMISIGIYNQPLSILLLVPQMMGKWSNIYPVLPWMSITVLGMVFGKELLNSQKIAYTRLLIAGLICLVLFPIVRGVSGFGNFQPPAGSSWIEFLNVVKYPPSLGFTLLTLGVNCVLLYMFEKNHHKLGKCKDPLLVFGKTALYFYFTHWFLFSGIGLPFFFIKANLLWLYGGWAVGLLMLYPICSQYLEFKQKTAPSSVWRFI
jgi:uncharacterized membrane protein